MAGKDRDRSDPSALTFDYVAFCDFVSVDAKGSASAEARVREHVARLQRRHDLTMMECFDWFLQHDRNKARTLSRIE